LSHLGSLLTLGVPLSINFGPPGALSGASGALFEALWVTFRAAGARVAQKECPWTIFLEMGRPGGTPKETFSNTFADILRKLGFRKTMLPCRREHRFDHLGCAGIMFFRHQQPLTNDTRPKHRPSPPPPSEVPTTPCKMW